MKLKPELTPEEIVRGRVALEKIKEVMNTPAQEKRRKDLGEEDLCESPHDLRGPYDTDAVDAFFKACGWSDFQIFVLAFAIAAERQGPNAVREIQKLSSVDAAWARHLATSREPQGGVQ